MDIRLIISIAFNSGLAVALIIMARFSSLQANLISQLLDASENPAVSCESEEALAKVNNDLYGISRAETIKYQDMLSACDEQHLGGTPDSYQQIEEDIARELRELHRRHSEFILRRDALLGESPEPSEDLEVPAE